LAALREAGVTAKAQGCQPALLVYPEIIPARAKAGWVRSATPGEGGGDDFAAERSRCPSSACHQLIIAPRSVSLAPTASAIAPSLSLTLDNRALLPSAIASD